MTFHEPAPATIDLRKYIDTAFYGSRPHIRGRRMLVSMIAANAASRNLTSAELAREFSLTEEEVLAALLYYREHQAEIEQQDIEEQKLFDAMYERDQNEKDIGT